MISAQWASSDPIDSPGNPEQGMQKPQLCPYLPLFRTPKPFPLKKHRVISGSQVFIQQPCATCLLPSLV